MEANPTAATIDEASPAAGEERCVSLDEFSDRAPRQKTVDVALVQVWRDHEGLVDETGPNEGRLRPRPDDDATAAENARLRKELNSLRAASAARAARRDGRPLQRK